MTADQVDSLRGAIIGRHLKHLCIKNTQFSNDGSLEEILSVCTNVEELAVPCRLISHYSALSRLLRDSNTILQYLDVYSYGRTELNNEVRHECMRQVISSLSGNTNLKSLEFGGIRQFGDEFEYIYNLLCNATSIRSIYNSNHTVERITGGGWQPFLMKYLKLNRNDDKVQVVCNKILECYFIGDFNTVHLPGAYQSVGGDLIFSSNQWPHRKDQ